MKERKRTNNKAAPARGAPRKRETIGNDGFSKDQKERLRSYAQERNVSVKSIIREAIDWYLDALEKAPIINRELEKFDRKDEEVIIN